MATGEQSSSVSGGPSQNPRRLLIGSVLAIFVLGCSVILAAMYAVQTIDRVAVANEVDRARAALQAIGPGPDIEARLRGEFLLDGARLTTRAALAQDEVSVATGRGAEVLAWTPHRIGSEMLYQLAPLRLAACVAFLFGVFLVIRRLYDMTRELELRRSQLTELATRDPLTGLGNRLAFDLWLANTGKEQVGLLYLDLDGFKQVNDSLGHTGGDALLKIVGDRIKALAGEADLVARIGGDEFAVVRRGPVDRTTLAELAADIGTALAEPIPLGTAEVTTAASVGIAIGMANDPDLVATADAALYRAKALPGHTFVFADAA